MYGYLLWDCTDSFVTVDKSFLIDRRSSLLLDFSAAAEAMVDQYARVRSGPISHLTLTRSTNQSIIIFSPYAKAK